MNKPYVGQTKTTTIQKNGFSITTTIDGGAFVYPCYGKCGRQNVCSAPMKCCGRKDCEEEWRKRYSILHSSGDPDSFSFSFPNLLRRLF